MPETDTEIQPTFDVLRLSNEVRKAVDELGYVNPTPVQRAIYEPAKKGRDLVVQARTGTGKTAAFGLPLVDGLVKPDVSAVQAMVLCPTRELALQVAKEITALSKYRELKVVSIYGGAPMQRQIDEIAGGAQILVGTPGRVLDHLRRGTLDPARIRVLVLDESDEMLSMGFLPQINEVLEALPKTLHTLLFSATVPRDVVRMAEDRLRDPSFITLSGDEIGALSIQHFTYLAAGDKLGDFLQVVETENPESAIIFCNTREQTKRVAHQLKQAGYDADWLNADLSQSERERVMAAVRESRLRFLVATDVAARGIDISHLTHVINYDFPESTEVYVHRTGRTGRAGRTGTAISMITPQDIGGVYMLKLTYRITPVERSLPSATEKRTRAELDLVEGLVRLAESRKVTQRDRALARRLLTHDRAEVVLGMLLQDHLGPREEAETEAAQARRAAKPTPAPRSKPSSNGKPRPERRPAPDTREREPQATQATKPEREPRQEREPKQEREPTREREPTQEREPQAEPAPRQGRGPKPEPKQERASRREREPKQERAPRREREPKEEPRQEREPQAEPAPRQERRRDRKLEQSPRGDERDSRGDSRRNRPTQQRARTHRDDLEDEVVEDDLDLPGYVVEDASPSLVAALTGDEGDDRGGGAAAAREPRGDRPRRQDESEPRPGRDHRGARREARDDGDRRGRSTASGAERPRRDTRRGETRPDAEKPGGEKRNGTPRESTAAKPERPSSETNGAETNVTLRTPTTDIAGDPEAVREIRVNVGRKDGARPSDFRRTLMDRGSLSDADTEHVNVRPEHTFVGVKTRVLDRAMHALNGATIAGKEAKAELTPSG